MFEISSDEENLLRDNKNTNIKKYKKSISELIKNNKNFKLLLKSLQDNKKILITDFGYHGRAMITFLWILHQIDFRGKEYRQDKKAFSFDNSRKKKVLVVAEKQKVHHQNYQKHPKVWI